MQRPRAWSAARERTSRFRVMRPLYMQTPRDWNREFFGGDRPRVDVLPHVSASGGFSHGRRTRNNTPLHAIRHFFGVAAGDAAPMGVAVAFTADSPFKVNFQWASAFFSPIFASTMTEQESPCSDCVT